MLDAPLDALLDALLPLVAPLFFLPTQQRHAGQAGVKSQSSPFSRSTRFPFTYRFAARAPCDSKGSEWAAKEKPTPISQIFLAPAAPGTPTRRHALGGLPTPPPPPENLLSDCTENCPLCPLRAPRRFGIRKSASNSGHSPLRGSGGCSRHCSMHYSMHCSTHCRPSLFAAHRR